MYTSKDIQIARARMPKLAKNMERLNNISLNVEKKWSNAPDSSYIWDASTIERVLYTLFSPEELNEKLSSEEIFLLITSIWLHDIGMILHLFPEDKVITELEELIEWEDKIKKRYEERTVRYLIENKNLELTYEEKDALIDVIRYLYIKDKELQEFIRNYWNKSIYTPLIFACLKLAKAFYIPHRIPEIFPKILIFNFNKMQKIKWLMSIFALQVSSVNKDLFKITFTLKKPHHININDWNNKAEPLRHMIEAELQNEVDAVKEILIRGKLSVFLTVECIWEEIPLTPEEVKELEELLASIFELKIKIKLIFSEEKRPYLLDISSLLYDLELLHDFSLFICGDEYKSLEFNKYFLFRKGRPIKGEDRIKAFKIEKESPLTIELILSLAVGLSGALWFFVQSIDKIKNWNLNKKKLEYEIEKLKIENNMKYYEEYQARQNFKRKLMENGQMHTFNLLIKRLDNNPLKLEDIEISNILLYNEEKLERKVE